MTTAMSTQAYYKDRLGFDPQEALNDGSTFDKSKQGYEENLSKFKDERDAIQKKTFTKWVNKHLKKANRHVGDLFLDLQDGLNLISLLEVLSGEHLPRERGKMRFHMLQNVQMALDFLRYKKIKLVNIRAEDIVDGNPKLTLGLIWTIILHFQISDIVVGQEPNVSAKEVLLRWARRSTAKYPGVRVNDFTGSWRDGLAFNALIHRNRPDLIDWRSVRSITIRERLERAFYVAEREYGVTRLLDPEDVDTHEIDEKSIITYISSLYDVFPEPPALHPLYDSDSQTKTNEYRELASMLQTWIREKSAVMSDRSFPSTLIEMKKLAAESARFRTDEVPVRQRDKTRLQQLFRDLQKYFEAVGEVDLDPELHVDVIDRNWNRLMLAHQERDQAIQDEIKRLERLQRLAEKVHREMKRCDSRLEDLESRILEEARRLDRLHPLDAKHNVDILEQELRSVEENIQSMFTDVTTLREGRYPQAGDLHKRVQKLHQRWVSLRSLLHQKLITPLSTLSFPVVEERTVTRQTHTVMETRLVDTNTHFRALQEAIEWCRTKLKQIQEAEYGSDLNSTQTELELHQREHKIIEQFHSKVEHCISAKNNFHGDELNLYTQHLNSLQKLYAELLTSSNKRLSDLETLLDFIQSATNQLVWLNEREETEVTRDWSDKDLNVPAIEQYYESLMSELEKREIQLSSVQDRGEALLLQHHPATKCIEAYMSALQTQWAWLLQLTLCLEKHLKHTAYYQQFYRDVKETENWINKRDELLNTVYSQSEFTLDEGERLLKGMQELREELNTYGEAVATLAERAQNVVPLKQRRAPVTRPLPVLAVCSYKQDNIVIEKGEQWVLHDNSGRVKWRVSNGSNGSDCNVPGAVFLIPPPDKEALDAVDRLKRQYERTLALWQRKQLRMRQNMIFATIKVVKSWDLAQFLAMGADQRNAIRRALNEDAGKLLAEGDPADPQLRRLKREMDEVNRLFDEFERRARAEEEGKNAVRLLTEQLSTLQQKLDEAEHTLNLRLQAPVPRDLDSLEHLVIQHKDFETNLKSLTGEVDAVQATLRSVTRKTPQLQAKVDKVLTQWNSLWNSSHLYIERLKCVEIVLTGLDDCNNVLSEFELKLAAFQEMPSELDSLQTVHEQLVSLQKEVAVTQPSIDQLVEDSHNCRRLVEKSRSHVHRGGPHIDLDRVDTDVSRVTQRWNNICSQLVDRTRSCEAAFNLLSKFKSSYQSEVTIIDDSYQQLNTIPPVQVKETIDLTKREQKLQQHLQSLQDLDTLLEELLAWLAGLESTLITLEAEPLPDDIPTIKQLIADHNEFMENTAQRTSEVDMVCKSRQPPALTKQESARKMSGKRMSTASLKASRDNLAQDRRGSRASVTAKDKLPDNVPHIGPRFPPKGSKGAEPVFRNPRCRLLWDRWRHVWLMAWERQRRLQERLTYLEELEKVKNFSWDQWRKRFLKFMNHKKSRLTDLFRKMDKNNDGLIPRDDFIDGIIKTKFDTSKMEMNAVADMFDHNSEGFIDWKEFIAALRPDWQEKAPTTEAEKIHDEVKRLVMLCTCRQKFRVFQVGEGKYRFGDSQKLRLVRILRSTVMVRVGGGWVALDEFLVKNDPCRAKGRTNIELREQFILADGVSQSMSAFKPKASPSSRSVSISSGSAGPITKVRERSARSVPMAKSGRMSGTPDSLSDNESSPLYSRTPRKVSTPSGRRSSLTPGGSLPGSRNNSRPPSRTGSKPPSRHGSNLSLASSDDGTPSRIPRRSLTSTRSASGSATPRKLTVPAVNGSASRTRSPSGLTTSSASTSSARSSIPRASSIPAIASNTTPSTARTRTPSGSSTPVPSAKVTRKPSGASDTSTGVARRGSSKSSTPTDPRAPFRL